MRSQISSLVGSRTEFAELVSIRSRFGVLKLKNRKESVDSGACALFGSLSSTVDVAKSDGAKRTKPCIGFGWQDVVQARVASTGFNNTSSAMAMQVKVDTIGFVDCSGVKERKRIQRKIFVSVVRCAPDA